MPLVSSLGVSLGGLNFIPTLLLEPREELDLQRILGPFESFLFDTILTVRTTQITLIIDIVLYLIHFISMSLHSWPLDSVTVSQRFAAVDPRLLRRQNSYKHSSPAQITQEFSGVAHS